MKSKGELVMRSTTELTPPKMPDIKNRPKTKADAGVISIFELHDDAKTDLKSLQLSKSDISKLSFIGKEFQHEHNINGLSVRNGTSKNWVTQGAFWDSIRDLNIGFASLLVPGLGQIMAAGPIVSCIVEVLESPLKYNSMAEIFLSLGISSHTNAPYETALNEGKCVMIGEGTRQEVESIRLMMANAGAKTIENFKPKPMPNTRDDLTYW
jgi:hypothetical protein